ncbi:MAG: DUF1566 domain-containing protein [Candidimonas sp.]|nr:MAG: DUF1566 domain-containing protein [Candidimonas sp.]TAM23734.1 MAG: DUF1566 domain-containing protein [Candidimonas sp.]
MENATAVEIPAINQPWPEQGGTYIGIRLVDGRPAHIIVPPVEQHPKGIAWRDGEAAIAGIEINGHNDWVFGDQRDLMLGYVNAPDAFDQDDVYWTATQLSSHYAWAVNFEYGDVDDWNKDDEFRVCPVRRLFI